MLRIPFPRKPLCLLLFKVFIALMLVCLPLLQEISALYYYGFTIAIVAPVILTLGTLETWDQHSSSSTGRLLQIVDTMLPILFCWSVMFPLPGISLKASFCILPPVLVAVLIGNLQLPVAVLQLVLSAMRLCTLLGHHRHDYHPLPDGASPNFVPSIVFFFLLQLCQGIFSIVAIFLGIISLPVRRSLVVELGFTTEKLGTKAVTLYFNQTYQARMEKGLFASEKHTPSLNSFAIRSLGCTSRESQIVALCLLDKCLERGDSKSNDKLIAEIVKDATNIITNITGRISYLTDDDEEGNSGDSDTDTQQKLVLCLSLKFVRRLAVDGRRIGAKFRKELLENPFFLNSLQRVLELDNSPQELQEPMMDIIATMALDKATRQEIGSCQAIIDRLMGAFLGSNNNPTGRTATGETLANLTILSPDNCWAILLPRQGHNLIKNLIDMLEDDNYICVAANILHNLCANSRDMLINLGANKDLESALPKVMEIIMTKEGKQLEAALASQIHYVIREYFAQVLLDHSDTDAAALVKKLVDTLNSNNEPCPKYPRMRRVLVEMVISIVDRCPRYISIFIENGANDALDMVKGTPSRFNKHRIFLGGKGVVTESLPMHELVDNAKGLIQATPTPTPGAQPGGHA